MTTGEITKIKSQLTKGTKYSLLKINKNDDNDDNEVIDITSDLKIMVNMEKKIIKDYKFTKIIKTGYINGLIDPIITKHYIITKNFIKESELKKKY